eukprot:1624963-Rhodomonas_salina.1
MICYAMSGTDLGCGTRPSPCNARWQKQPWTTGAEVRCTDLAYAAMICYALCGTDLAYAATRRAERARGMVLTVRYGATEEGVEATFVVSMVDRAGYQTLWSYALSGTDLDCDATGTCLCCYAGVLRVLKMMALCTRRKKESGGDHLHVILSGPAVFVGEVSDYGNGSYGVSYTAYDPGQYDMEVGRTDCCRS